MLMDIMIFICPRLMVLSIFIISLFLTVGANKYLKAMILQKDGMVILEDRNRIMGVMYGDVLTGLVIIKQKFNRVHFY
jgi:hypothetical protein